MRVYGGKYGKEYGNEGWWIIFGAGTVLTWKYINVKINRWPLIFVLGLHEFTFSHEISKTIWPVSVNFNWNISELGKGVPVYKRFQSIDGHALLTF